MPRCEKRGCALSATVLVIVNDPDGRQQFRSCKPHALEFENWAREEVRRQTGWLVERKEGNMLPWDEGMQE